MDAREGLSMVSGHTEAFFPLTVHLKISNKSQWDNDLQWHCLAFKLYSDHRNDKCHIILYFLYGDTSASLGKIANRVKHLMI